MRKVIVHRSKCEEDTVASERLAELLSTGLQRYFERQRGVAVDLTADESVTTTCPDEGAARNSASDDH